MPLPFSETCRDAIDIFRIGVAAVDPATAMRRALHLEPGVLRVGSERLPLPPATRIWLAGAGKAAGAMAAAAEEILGERLAGGVLVTKYGHGLPLRRCRLLEAGHPLPDATGEAAAAELLDFAAGLVADDLLLCLISGGGSALLPAPAAGISLAEKQRTTDLLLRAGAGITELNAVRKHLSRIKGGGLLQAALPARLATLAISDVVGDPPEVIASGPTVPDPSLFSDALAVIERYRLTTRLPASVLRHLQAGVRGERVETLKSIAADRPIYQLIASNAQACSAAAEAASGRGYEPEVVTSELTGEARRVAAELVARARDLQTRLPADAAPRCLIYGGETTVTVRGLGRGGRNQELALAAAIAMDGCAGITLLAAGTDGNDGPTDAAGAVVDGGTLDRGRQRGLGAETFLAGNDSYNYFAGLGELLKTGPTRTNVMDLTLLLITPTAAAAPDRH